MPKRTGRRTILPAYRAVSIADRTEQTRRRIAEAAGEAFVIHGYEVTTIEAVAALAGVSPRTVYRHFGSKGALFAATIAIGAADFLEQLAAYVERWPLRRAILTAFADTVVGASDESRAIMNLATVEDDVSAHWLATSQRMYGPLGAILRKAAGEELDDAMVWEVRASALLSALTVAYRHWSTDPSDLMMLIGVAIDTVLPAL